MFYIIEFIKIAYEAFKESNLRVIFAFVLFLVILPIFISLGILADVLDKLINPILRLLNQILSKVMYK